MSGGIPREHLEHRAREAAKLLKEQTPDGYGFILFMMKLGEGGDLTYVSTIERQDAIKSILEWMEVIMGDRLDADGNPESRVDGI